MVLVTGTVTDRIDDSPISGSTIAFDGSFAGRGLTTASIVDGRYELAVPAGGYKVTIAGPSHVRHQTLNLGVFASSTLDFSVLEWSSGRFGAVYDQTFENFFNRIARHRDIGHVWKWDSYPVEIFVDQDPRLSSETFDLFMDILTEVNRDSVPSMFGGQIPPLPIRVGSVSALEHGLGRIVIRFTEGQTGAAASCFSADVTLVGCGIVTFSVSDLALGRQRATYVVAHELYHTAFATHDAAHEVGMPSSLMENSRATTLSAEDKLAAYLVYHPHTRPGNRAPDDNPDYKSP
jgi:hypothetical protein